MDMAKVCTYCNEVIDPDAPAMQTTSVDVASLTGDNRSHMVVSKVKSYHIKDPNCYRLSVMALHEAQAPSTARTDKAVGPETHEWSAAFGMSPDEALSGKRRKYSGVNQSVARIQRKAS